MDRRRGVVAVFLVLVGCEAAPPGAGDPTARSRGWQTFPGWTGQEDVVVSDPTRRLNDPEFDPLGDRFVWADEKFRVWLGYVDPATGDFVPPDGRGALIDAEGADYSLLANGPEWVLTNVGSQILYTQERDVQIYLATAGYRDGWFKRRLYGGDGEVSGIGSLTVGDPNPHITYLDSAGEKLRWRNLDGDEDGLLGPLRHTVSAPRFVDGEAKIIWSVPIDGVDQIILLDLASGAREQLTFDTIGHIEPYLVHAPELNELVFVSTRLNAARQPIALDVFRESGGVWTLYHQIHPPREYRFVQSPEPLVYNGGSYVSYVADKYAERWVDGDGVAWLVGLMPGSPVNFRVSDDAPMRRKDPETYIGDGAAWLYYTEVADIRKVHRCALPL